jgi:hypothetical protein
VLFSPANGRLSFGNLLVVAVGWILEPVDRVELLVVPQGRAEVVDCLADEIGAQGIMLVLEVEMVDIFILGGRKEERVWAQKRRRCPLVPPSQHRR